MPKRIELTVELNIQQVSCPGVWLCQDGRVSLTVFSLGTSYQTCLLPPIFPLTFRDTFYFRKRFQESCALNNICCLLKDETIYCELVQWQDRCAAEECTILAQYLGSLNDVLFPSNVCSNEGVDLLMRRSREFPGILSPKIEITTKVRIDELWSQEAVSVPKPLRLKTCGCKVPSESVRQKQVCHTPMYHRIRCPTRPPSASRRPGTARSTCSLARDDLGTYPCIYTSSRPSVSSNHPQCAEYSVYNVQVPSMDQVWRRATTWPQNEYSGSDSSVRGQRSTCDIERHHFPEATTQKLTLESQYIDEDCIGDDKNREGIHKTGVEPCVCEICKRYHELFHRDWLNC